MSVQYNSSHTVNVNGTNPVTGTWVDVGNNDLGISQVIAAGTDTPLGITFNGANLQCFELISSQPLTLKINSTSAPFATFNLKAGIPFAWSASAGYYSNPINTNVTQIYATCTTACTLKGRVLTT